MPRNAPKMHSDQSKFLFLAAVLNTGQAEPAQIERGADDARKLSGSSFHGLHAYVCSINDDSCSEPGSIPRHQNHIVFPDPKMEPRKGLRPMVGLPAGCLALDRVPRAMVWRDKALHWTSVQRNCGVSVQRQCNIECNTGRNVVNSEGSAHLSCSDSHFHLRRFLVV